jgi:histone chaperone ASF1
VLDNPCPLTRPFSFEITFECLAPYLSQDLEWKVIYVGSAESCEHDQILECVAVGPVPQGMHKFVLESSAPDISLLSMNDELLGVTVVLITCTYRQQEFVRIGYYVNNELIPNSNNHHENMQQKDDDDDESLSSSSLLDPPPHAFVSHDVVRTILADKPRVTRFPIAWDEHDDDRTTTTLLYNSPFKEKESSSLHQPTTTTTTTTLRMDNDEQENMAAIVSPPSTQTTTDMEVS